MRILCLLFILALGFGCEQKKPVITPEPVIVDTFALNHFGLVDSFLLDKDQKDSPRLECEVDIWLVNTGTPAFQQLVNDSVFSTLSGYSPRGADDYHAHYRQMVAEAIEDYKMEAKEEGFYYNYGYYFSAKPVVNKGGVLTMDAFNYGYMGGAHGFGYTTYLNFADAPARLLEYEQIFQPMADSSRISSLLTEHLTDDQRGMLFEPTKPVYVTKNIGLLQNGIAFHYPQYELAPYAAGPIEIVLPYEVLLQEQLLRSEVGNLVKDLGE